MVSDTSNDPFRSMIFRIRAAFSVMITADAFGTAANAPYGWSWTTCGITRMASSGLMHFKFIT